MSNVATFSWLQVIATVAGSGLASAAFTNAVTAFVAHRANTREATYTALRVALAFEEFVEKSVQAQSDLDEFSRRGTEQYPDVGMPPDPAFEAGLDWRGLPAELSSAALTFASELRLSRGQVSVSFDHGGGINVLRGELIRSGVKAWSIAKRLRARFRLPSLELDSMSWNYVASLMERAEDFDRAEKHRADFSEEL